MSKILRMRSLRADDVERAAVERDLLERSDEHAEAGGVEELDLLDVDDQSRVSGLDGRRRRFAQAWSRVDVDLAADLDDRRMGPSVSRRRAPTPWPSSLRTDQCSVDSTMPSGATTRRVTVDRSGRLGRWTQPTC